MPERTDCQLFFIEIQAAQDFLNPYAERHHEDWPGVIHIKLVAIMSDTIAEAIPRKVIVWQT